MTKKIVTFVTDSCNSIKEIAPLRSVSVLRTDFHAIDTDRSGAISLIELQEYVTKVTIFFVIYALYLF